MTTRQHRADAPHPPDRARETQTLKRLWEEHTLRPSVGIDYEADYLRSHCASDVTLDRRIRVLDMIAPLIRGRVLEWGCRHGLDSCVYRMRFGAGVTLFGCDACEPELYEHFHAFSGMSYSRLTHPFRLDYDDASFDVVTSNGVLEHVPDDAASVAEIHRLLRPGGTFAVTCLPNRYSYTEALQRWRGATAHDRLYSLRGTRRLLRASGFEVVAARRFFMLPTMLNGFPAAVRDAYQSARGVVWPLNDLLERAWPLNHLASNLMITAVKPG